MQQTRSGMVDVLRAFLILGRTSNLPTVWSNCLAGWLLAGGGESAALLQLSLGATLLYIGGMFLNDACDADFDRRYRGERPIPRGTLDEETVWLWSYIWLGSGALFLIPVGVTTGVLTVLLVGGIVLYNAVHKMVASAPVLMAGCRFLLYLVAASMGDEGITGLAVWSALVLGCYVAGLSFLARKESIRPSGAGGGSREFELWPCYLMAAPVLLAMIVNSATDDYFSRAVLLSTLLAVWVWSSIRRLFAQGGPDVGGAVSGLLAGIVWVDLLAVLGGGGLMPVLFVGLFVAARFAQRYIPAT